MAKGTINLMKLINSADQNERMNLLVNNIERMVKQILQTPVEQSLNHDNLFTQIGLDSITAVMFKDLINDSLDQKFELKSPDIFDHPTIKLLSSYIAENLSIDGLDSIVEKSDEIDHLSEDEIIERLKGEIDDQ